MLTFFANEVPEGFVLQGEPIYKIVNHPSGIAFYDVMGELIQVNKPMDSVTVEMPW